MRYRLLFTAWLLLAVGLTACRAREEEPEQWAATYRIYYLNSSLTALSPQDYGTNTVIGDQVIEELMEQFLTAPNDVENQVALPAAIGYLGYKQEDRVLNLYFDVSYGNHSVMDPTREILCRAALTKTMTQIDGIDYISIYTGDQPLLSGDGNPVGLLADADFIESISDVNTFERSELRLFFTDETGSRLLVEDREVVHAVNTSPERLVVEEILKGPQLEGRYAVIPADVKLLNLSVNENVCYINFDASFLSSLSEVKEYIPIYAVVNSLCQLPTVSRVQFTVNGSSDVMFRDAISLDTQFEEDPEIGKERE